MTSDNNPQNAAPPVVNAPPPSAEKPESSMTKTILTIVETIVLGLIGFGFGGYYNNLAKSSDVKWTRGNFECTNAPACDTGQVKIKVYKLGGDAMPKVRLFYALADPNAGKITNHLVERYEVSLLNYVLTPGKNEANGQTVSLPADDPEINPNTAVEFSLNQLEAGQVYELTLTIHVASGNVKPSGNFQIRDAANKKIDYEGLRGRDYVRLYLVEAIVLTVLAFVALVVLTFGLTWRGSAFIAPILRPFRRKGG